MTKKIIFDSPIPYYVQLMEIIRAKVDNKEWLPDEQIPSEHELCDYYQVSRTVTRMALKELETEGIINRRKGVGTFIAKPKIKEGFFHKLSGFYQEMNERGLKVSTQVLYQDVNPCSEKVANYLDINEGTAVIETHRLRFINNNPIQLVKNYIPYDICPDLATIDLTDRSLYEILEGTCGVYIAKGHRFIEAVSANKREAELLDIQLNAPLILLESISYSQSNKPVEYYKALHRGDRSRFEVEVLGLRELGNDKS
jgi:GntR family transcriptional regulator